MRNAKETNAFELRRDAEAKLEQGTPEQLLDIGDTRRLLHELQVHQVELETQNENLRLAQAEAHKVTQQLAELNQHLEQLVATRTAELVVALDAAEAANRAKSDFLTNMSHEIRTPLNAITGMTYLVRQSGVTPTQDERLRKIEAAGQHLLAIINVVLDLSKIEAGKFALDEAAVDVEAVVAKVAALLLDSARKKNLELRVESHPLPQRLLGDATRLQQALLNYAANAIKFTPSGSVSLAVQCEEDFGDIARLRFEVRDTGVGIDATVIERLFSPFEQGDNSSTRHHGGTGLGLVVTRKLARLMGGDAGVRSTPGVGSTFWFTARLRKAPVSVAAVASLPVEVAESLLREYHAGKQILLVDDDPLNLEIAAFLLGATGLGIDSAVDGEDAITKFSAKDYHLILMDVQMPRLDGLTATTRIRALPGGLRLPIIAMTANAFAEDRQSCLAAGMNDFVAKPYDPNALLTTLLKWLNKK